MPNNFYIRSRKNFGIIYILDLKFSFIEVLKSNKKTEKSPRTLLSETKEDTEKNSRKTFHREYVNYIVFIVLR